LIIDIRDRKKKKGKASALFPLIFLSSSEKETDVIANSIYTISLSLFSGEVTLSINVQ
jgi:hypothetical protein